MTEEEHELLAALVVAHRQVDTLLAMVINLDYSFRPSQSALWLDIVKRAELISRYSGKV